MLNSVLRFVSRFSCSTLSSVISRLPMFSSHFPPLLTPFDNERRNFPSKRWMTSLESFRYCNIPFPYVTNTTVVLCALCVRSSDAMLPLKPRSTLPQIGCSIGCIHCGACCELLDWTFRVRMNGITSISLECDGDKHEVRRRWTVFYWLKPY